jgi:hypothetical protein
MLKVTPQLLIAPTRSSTCLAVLWFGGLFRLSFLSHSMASLTRLSVNLSVIQFNSIYFAQILP